MNFKEIAENVIKTEAEELLKLKIDENSINKAIELIYNIKGKLIVMGVGKSGLVGSKISATLASTGTSSFFIHPTEAMHGDLGMIDKNDLVLAISYSGESEELIKTLPHLKRLQIPILSIVKTKNSTLGNYSDIVLEMGIKKEACPLNIAPTTSTTLTMALGDAIAVSLMYKRGFKKEDFASFHPGGSLGKQLFVKVSDIMRRDNLPIIDERSSLQDAIFSMNSGRLGNVVITKNNKLIALLSDGDIRRALLNNEFSLNENVLKYASLNPIVIDNNMMLASEALKIIEKKKIQMLIVVDDSKNILGLLHIHDLIEAGIK